MPITNWAPFLVPTDPNTSQAWTNLQRALANYGDVRDRRKKMQLDDEYERLQHERAKAQLRQAESLDAKGKVAEAIKTGNPDIIASVAKMYGGWAEPTDQPITAPAPVAAPPPEQGWNSADLGLSAGPVAQAKRRLLGKATEVPGVVTRDVSAAPTPPFMPVLPPGAESASAYVRGTLPAAEPPAPAPPPNILPSGDSDFIPPPSAVMPQNVKAMYFRGKPLGGIDNQTKARAAEESNLAQARKNYDGAGALINARVMAASKYKLSDGDKARIRETIRAQLPQAFAGSYSKETPAGDPIKVVESMTETMLGSPPTPQQIPYGFGAQVQENKYKKADGIARDARTSWDIDKALTDRNEALLIKEQIDSGNPTTQVQAVATLRRLNTGKASTGREYNEQQTAEGVLTAAQAMMRRWSPTEKGGVPENMRKGIKAAADSIMRRLENKITRAGDAAVKSLHDVPSRYLDDTDKAEFTPMVWSTVTGGVVPYLTPEQRAAREKAWSQMDTGQ